MDAPEPITSRANAPIDRPSRRRLAEGIRHLVSGQITNDQFEDDWVVVASPDPAVCEIFSHGAWMLYSDLEEHRLTGRRRLPRQARHEIAKWILFLETDLAYEWPRSGLAWSLANLLTLGHLRRRFRREWSAKADFDAWPFLRRADLDDARARFPFEGGRPPG